eukprot:scaffold116384_cov53-Attheya_sp.AAC.8
MILNQRASVMLNMIAQQSWEEVKMRVETNPNEASVAIYLGENIQILPLHEACRIGAPLDVIKVLVNENRNALRTEGQFGYLPLHFACTCTMSLEAIQLLVELYPIAIRTPDAKGKYPLHIACQYGQSTPTIRFLVQSNPGTVYLRDVDNKRPGDHAKITNAKNLFKVQDVLSRADEYCEVSKAAQLKTEKEFSISIRALEEEHEEKLTQLQSYFQDELSSYRHLEEMLRRELDTESEKVVILNDEVSKNIEKINTITSAHGDLVDQLEIRNGNTLRELEEYRQGLMDTSHNQDEARQTVESMGQSEDSWSDESSVNEATFNQVVSIEQLESLKRQVEENDDNIKFLNFEFDEEKSRLQHEHRGQMKRLAHKIKALESKHEEEKAKLEEEHSSTIDSMSELVYKFDNPSNDSESKVSQSKIRGPEERDQEIQELICELATEKLMLASMEKRVGEHATNMEMMTLEYTEAKEQQCEVFNNAIESLTKQVNEQANEINDLAMKQEEEKAKLKEEYSTKAGVSALEDEELTLKHEEEMSKLKEEFDATMQILSERKELHAKEINILVSKHADERSMLEEEFNTRMERELQKQKSKLEEEYNAKAESQKLEVEELNSRHEEEMSNLEEEYKNTIVALSEEVEKHAQLAAKWKEEKCQLEEEFNKKIESMAEQVDQLEVKLSKHDEEMLQLRNEYDSKLEALKNDRGQFEAESEADFALRWEKEKSKLEAEFNTKVESLTKTIEKQSTEIDELTSKHETEMTNVEENCNTKVESLTLAHEETTSKLQEDYTNTIESLSKQLDVEMEKLGNKCDEKVESLMKKVSSQATEIEELKAKHEAEKKDLEGMYCAKVEPLEKKASDYEASMREMTARHLKEQEDLEEECMAKIEALTQMVTGQETELVNLKFAESESSERSVQIQQRLRTELEEEKSRVTFLLEEVKRYEAEIETLSKKCEQDTLKMKTEHAANLDKQALDQAMAYAEAEFDARYCGNSVGSKDSYSLTEQRQDVQKLFGKYNKLCNEYSYRLSTMKQISSLIGDAEMVMAEAEARREVDTGFSGFGVGVTAC